MLMDQTPIDRLPKNVQDDRITRQQSAIAAGRLVSLDFKVPMRVGQQFKDVRRVAPHDYA
jgi:hypothetical protein